MADAPVADLLLAAAATALWGWFWVRRDLSRPAALVAVAVKTLFPLAFFAFVFDGTQMLLDDARYFHASGMLQAYGVTPWSALADDHDAKLLFATANSAHVGYYWWNLVARGLFGPYYWAPVFLNVGLTYVAGYWAVRLVRRAEGGAAGGFLLFFLLHWDVLVWSSRLNLKDTAVMTLGLGILYATVRMSEPGRVKRALGLAVLVWALLFTRFYAVGMLATAIGAWLLLAVRDGRRWFLIPVVAAPLFYVMFIARGITGYVQPGAFAEGAARFLVTPRPWAVEAKYGFLTVPAALHWLSLPVAVPAAVALWRRSRIAQLVLIHFGIGLLFYAVVPQLQGPRHRVQFALALAWAQFFGWRALLRGATMPASLRPAGEG